MEIVDRAADVRDLTEEEKREIAVEQMISTIFEERIAELEFNQEDSDWVRLSGDRNYELSKGHLDKIVARSRLYFLINPLINRAVTLQADYVFAQGVNIQATNKEVNRVIQYFIDDKQNKRELTGHQARLMKEQTLMLDGNIFLVLFTDTQGTGRVQVRSILIDEITQIIANPDDQNEIWYYKREWTSEQLDGASTINVAYYPDIDYIPTFRISNIDNKPIIWDAPIYHIKAGGLSKSKFGVPETYAALDWAQAHRRFLEDWATIVRSYARFAFRLIVSGGKNAVAAAKTRLNSTVTSTNSIERNPAPVAGSTFIAPKDGSSLEPIKTAGATTSAQDGRELRMMVAAALGIPDTFFGDVDVGNLATARTLDRPTELKYRSRQTMWQDVFNVILAHVIKWSIIAPKGPLKNKINSDVDMYGSFSVGNDELTGEQFDTHVEITFPPILEHSIIDRINAVANAVTLNGKSFSVDSPELAKLTLRLMLQALGTTDIDEVLKKIFEDIDKQPVNTTKNDPGSDTMPGSNEPEQRDDER